MGPKQLQKISDDIEKIRQKIIDSSERILAVNDYLDNDSSNKILQLLHKLKSEYDLEIISNISHKIIDIIEKVRHSKEDEDKIHITIIKDNSHSIKYQNHMEHTGQHGLVQDKNYNKYSIKKKKKR